MGDGRKWVTVLSEKDWDLQVTLICLRFYQLLEIYFCQVFYCFKLEHYLRSQELRLPWPRSKQIILPKQIAIRLLPIFKQWTRPEFQTKTQQPITICLFVNLWSKFLIQKSISGVPNLREFSILIFREFSYNIQPKQKK